VNGGIYTTTFKHQVSTYLSSSTIHTYTPRCLSSTYSIIFAQYLACDQPDLYKMSAVEDDYEDCRIPPKLDYRWCHSGASHLSLPSTPLTQTKTITYTAFSVYENDHLEAAFNALTPKEREAAMRKMGDWKEDKKEETPENYDKDGKVKDPEGKDGEVIVGDTADIDKDIPRKGSLAPSMDAERYPDPDSQPIQTTTDEEPEEEDYDVIKGVPVAQASCSRL
jgi:hypothetical protein